jgi:hypothetical protein
MLVFPLLLITSDFDDVLPMATLPKFTDAGLKAKMADAGDAAAAFKLMDAGEFVALLTTLRFPENVPAL